MMVVWANLWLLIELLLQGMLLNLIHYNKPPISDTWLESRLKVLVEACEGNSSLLKEAEKLNTVAEKSSL